MLKILAKKAKSEKLSNSGRASCGQSLHRIVAKFPLYWGIHKMKVDDYFFKKYFHSTAFISCELNRPYKSFFVISRFKLLSCWLYGVLNCFLLKITLVRSFMAFRYFRSCILFSLKLCDRHRLLFQIKNSCWQIYKADHFRRRMR